MADSAAEVFTEVEHEVAEILSDLADLVRARSPSRCRTERRERREEIPSWGCRRRRSVPPAAAAAAEKPASTAPVSVEVVVASPDTPLMFLPDESSGGDGGDEVAAPAPPTLAAAEAYRKVAAPASSSHAEWVQEQRAVVASLSEENSHLYKQIEEYKIRLQSSRSTNDDLKLMHGKLKRQREEEEKQLKRKLPATAMAIDRPAPALVLDLNKPARAPVEEDDEAAAAAAAAMAAAEWYQLGQQRGAMACKAAMTAEARHRRREIRRAKAAPSRIRRGGS